MNFEDMRGIQATIVWDNETGKEESVYLSLGHFNDESLIDEYGVHDDDVFYYMTDDELPFLMEKGWTKWHIVSWEGVSQ